MVRFQFYAISFLLDESQECLGILRATNSKETVVRSPRNFTNATFLASPAGKLLRPCRSSVAAFNPCQSRLCETDPFLRLLDVRQPLRVRR